MNINHRLFCVYNTYLFALNDWTFTIAFIESHSKIVKKKAILRKIILASQITIDDAQKGIKTVSDIIFDSQKMLEDLNNSA